MARPPGLARALADPTLSASVLLLWGTLALFVLYPLAVLLARVFWTHGALSFAGLHAILGDPYQLRSLWNSLLLATLVGVTGTLLGLVFAFAAERCELPPWMLTVVDAAALLPLISPPFTTAIAMIFSFGPRGLITYNLLGIKGFNVYGLGSTLFSEALTYFPIAYLTLRPVLAAIDANVEAMGLSLGASRWRLLYTVTLPLAVPGLANSFLLLFAASLADFATPLILAGNAFPVLPTQAYLQITGLFDLRGGATLSFVLLVPALAVFALQRYWVARAYYVTVTGKGGAQTRLATVARWVRWPLGLGCALVTLVTVYLYALLLFASLVKAFGADHAWTLSHYQHIFTDGWKAIRDTLIIAALSMPLGGPFGIMVGYLVARREFAGRRSMELVSLLNYSLPGTIVGIAYLLAFNEPPIVLTGTAIVIVACYVFRYGATGIRATVALLAQIDRSLEEASQSLGASTATTFRRVTLPLIVPAFFAGLGIVFIRSMTAISATIFLVSISWTLITVKILNDMTELLLGPAAAYSVLVIAIVFVVIAAIGWLLRRLRAPGSRQVASLFSA